MSVKSPRILAPVFTDLLAKFIAPLGNQTLPELVHYLALFRCFCQLSFGRREQTFELGNHVDL